MASFFKTFGKGVLAVVLIPVYLLMLVVVGVFGLIGFIVMSIKGLIMFFTGRNLYDDLPEDKKAKETLNRLTHKINPENREQVVTPEPAKVGNQDPFYIPEYMREPAIDDRDKQLQYHDARIPQQEPEYEEEILVPHKDQSYESRPQVEEPTPLGREEENIKEAGFDGDFDDFMPNNIRENDLQNENNFNDLDNENNGEGGLGF